MVESVEKDVDLAVESSVDLAVETSVDWAVDSGLHLSEEFPNYLRNYPLVPLLFSFSYAILFLTSEGQHIY